MAHPDVLDLLADAIAIATTLVRGTTLLLGPPGQSGDEQIHDDEGNALAVTYLYLDSGREPELHFASRALGTDELPGWWYPGFEVQTRSAPRDYKSGIATALSVHRALAAMSSGALLRTKIDASAPELRRPNRQGQHTFITRGAAWYFNTV